VLLELRSERCGAPLADVDRALRTLAERSTDTPLRLFRDLLARARAGDLLIDAAEDAARVVAAELAARSAYAWDPDDPSTWWDWPTEAPPPEPPDPVAELVERRARALAAENAAREQIRTRVAPASGARFLTLLRPDVADDIRS
jgi:hypothetical protein